MFCYERLVSRNWAFISPENQQKLKQCKILFAGCGLGCNIARDLAALGVENFILYDGDIVELSNLNRQVFSITQLGCNKAQATADIIKGVNPQCSVEVYPFYIHDLEIIQAQIESADFVVNTVDYHSPVFLTLTDYSQHKGKHVFFPTNIGWGAVVMVFSPTSISMADYLSIRPGTVCDLSTFLMRLAKDYLPPHLDGLYRSFLEEGRIGKWPCVPQIMPGAQLVSALISALIVKLLSGLPVKTAPEFYVLDAWGE
jgi:molybdopterin/thiamine biosynthesis adenylyltransferase